MRLSALAAAALLFALTQTAQADLLIHIDKGTQRMTVTVDGRPRYVWPVSTGIAQYDTPDGDFRPFRMEKDHFSKEWDDAPMPYSIFFTKQGHAIHGTNHTSIGRPASHGCVRLSVAHAAQLWELVTAEGMNKTKVVLTGEVPGSDAVATRRYRDDQTTGSAPREARTNLRYYSTDDVPPAPPGYVYRYQQPQPYYYQQYQRPVYRDNSAPFSYFPFGGRY
jgi:L,D-transpeptidase-like protein